MLCILTILLFRFRANSLVFFKDIFFVADSKFCHWNLRYCRLYPSRAYRVIILRPRIDLNKMFLDFIFVGLYPIIRFVVAARLNAC